MLRQRGAHETPARQSERPGDEHEPAEARLLAQTLVEGEVPVTVVAEDGQAVGGQVDADLMRAPRPELELEEGAGTGRRLGRGRRSAAVGRDEPPLGEGGLAAVAAGDRLVEAAAFPARRARDDRTIGLAQLPRLDQAGPFRGRDCSTGDDEAAGGLLVEPVDEEGPEA